MTRSSLCLAALFVCASAACGGGDDEADTTGGEVVSQTCAGYAQSDACIDPTNFEQCRSMEAQCPGQVQVMESCPLQFSCPSASHASSAACPPGGAEPVQGPDGIPENCAVLFDGCCYQDVALACAAAGCEPGCPVMRSYPGQITRCE